MGGWDAGRNRCTDRLFRAYSHTGLPRRQGVEEAGEMAVEDVYSTGPCAGVDRSPAGWLFQHGQRRHYRYRNSGNLGGCSVDPAAVQDQPCSAGGGQRSGWVVHVHAQIASDGQTARLAATLSQNQRDGWSTWWTTPRSGYEAYRVTNTR